MARVRPKLGPTLAWAGAFALLASGCSAKIGDSRAPKAPNCTSGPIPASPMLRLTRAEYDNLAHDLLGASFRPSSVLANDEKVGPFAVNGQTQASRELIDEYEYIAEKLATEVASHATDIAPCASPSDQGFNCAAQFLERFGRRAFRRPLTGEEKARWLALFDAQSKADGYAAGISAMVEGILQSPSFLYRAEPAPVGTADGGPYALDGYALASRLSFLLWNSGPDDALLDAAGDLSNPQGLDSQVKRMLADDRSLRTMDAFAGAWAGLDELDAAASSPERLGGLDPALLPDMRSETVRFIDDVLRRGDGRVATLLTASYSLPSAQLAHAIYGIDAVPDAQGRVQLDPQQRSGLLSQASVLFTHAHAQQTSPVLRGKWVRESLLCQKMPDPPPGVNTTPPAVQPGMSTRQRFMAHRTNPNCASCHQLMDDVGFGFERFDQFGRTRTTDNGAAIDTTGALAQTDVDGTFNGVVELGRKLAASPQVNACFARQWLRYGLGRMDSSVDGCLVQQMSSAADREGYRGMVRALVQSDSFRTRSSP